MTFQAWEALATDRRLDACTSTECATLKAMVASFQQLDARDFPNSMARDDDDSRTGKKELPLVGLVATSRSAGQEACRLLISLVENVKDLSMTLHALEMATLIEGQGAHCLAKVVAATPSELDGTDVLPDALSLCEARKEPYCSKLHKRAEK